MEPVDPDTFYRRNAYRPYIEKEDQARQAVQDELSSSKRNRLDAIEWWLRNDPRPRSGRGGSDLRQDFCRGSRWEHVLCFGELY